MSGNEVRHKLIALQLPVAELARRAQTTRETVYRLLRLADGQLPAEWEQTIGGVLDEVRSERLAALKSIPA
jgi:hypothetical protein